MKTSFTKTDLSPTVTRIDNYISGQRHTPYHQTYLDNYRPATGQIYGQIAASTSEDVQNAVKSAKNAFPIWSKMTREKRSQILMRAADIIESRLDEFAEAESFDQGKPVSLAKAVDIPRACKNLRFFAGAILHSEDMATEIDGACVNYSVSQPIGVVGLISPWNLPLYLLTWKIAPAIAVGNTCVCKPSEMTSLTASMICEVLSEAGLPDGVVNMVFGYGHQAGQAIVEHPDVPVISFTGGTVTGEIITKTAAPMVKKLSLELGGKNANIVFDDCNLEKAIATSIRSSFANQGEICLCGSRIFVQQGVYDEFVKGLVEGTEKLVLGDPADPNTTTGALISEQHMDKVLSYIEKAKALNATIETGGERYDPGGEFSGGYFVKPTIITGVGNDCVVCQEEIFGPVVNIVPFETEEEVIALANDIQYGLSASVWTENIGKANRVALGLQVGTVWINTWLQRDLRVPFGGQKMSGVGREGGKFSLEFYTEQKTICVNYT